MSVSHVKQAGTAATQSTWVGYSCGMLDRRGNTLVKLAARVDGLMTQPSELKVESDRLRAGVWIYDGNLDRAHFALATSDEAAQLAMALVERGVYAALPLVRDVRTESLALARATSRGERSLARALAALRAAG